MAPLPSTYRSEPTTILATRAAHRYPCRGESICSARKGSHHFPTLTAPCIRRRADWANGVPEAIDARKYR